MKYTCVIGIDEVGRGPLAGPVAVGAVILYDVKAAERLFVGFKDSKKMTPAARATWNERIASARAANLLDFAVTCISATTIDTIGLAPSIRKALSSSITKLEKRAAQSQRVTIDPTTTRVLLDGGLKAPQHYPHQQTIIKGDEKELSIALASIVAKVHRDSLMIRYARAYPQHFFDIHKGYGTAKHYAAIKKHGLTPLHRRTFLKKLNLPQNLAKNTK